MTVEEYRTYNRLQPRPHNSVCSSKHTVVSSQSLPSTVDWRTKGYVTPVKNQGQCGSCWAFSTTGSVEGQHFNKTGVLLSLSEQQLVDCSQDEGNQGCDGGIMDNGFAYIMSQPGGLETESNYPYTAMDGNCTATPSLEVAKVSGCVDVDSEDEDALQHASALVGPVSVAIDASHDSFQSYSGGVYTEDSCSTTQLDHGVLVVGYGTYQGQDYWLVKNSWGSDWGLNGYIMMARNQGNMCGIATLASYPLV
ncbi:procathepsin L-like [Babylonia areolata]|uniref:procathepsin L-like n=1 Tax=Babylonia areolata TaxID=304850 RepID=UPI003FD38E0B